jgi:hypothetical protein
MGLFRGKKAKKSGSRVLGVKPIVARRHEMMKIVNAREVLEERLKDKDFRREIEGEVKGAWRPDSLLDFARAHELKLDDVMKLAKNILKRRQ